MRLAIHDARRFFLITIWFYYETKPIEVYVATCIVLPGLSLKCLKDHRQPLLTVNYKPDVRIRTIERWQNFC
jgi:hypothetical protein